MVPSKLHGFSFMKLGFSFLDKSLPFKSHMDIVTICAVLAVIVAFYALYYFVVCVHDTEILYNTSISSDSDISNAEEGLVDIGDILRRCQRIKKFYPNFFFFNKHMQTMGCKFLRRKSPVIRYRRENFPLSDGGGN